MSYRCFLCTCALKLFGPPQYAYSHSLEMHIQTDVPIGARGMNLD